MFAESKKAKMEPTTGLTNRIAENTKIKGDITSEADIRIDGELDGSVNTSGKIVIGRSGKVTGKINCANADIEGKFNGELKVENILSLKSSADIEGDVVVGKLAVEPGANFNAACTMKGAAVKSLKGDEKQGSKAEKSA
ncbi:bactofilin family protein [Robertkochia solimangrovi]|uniref:bactofilin family protein n=1 Tax=Robertkochia solimangrovi TaxID=2213046 RepID=UPI00117BEE95|nr:polymer-forming cytoskeletal protein [Robertkochia solimangrovi]TRZ46009.1 polymer-forming cytoskeletal protein [Robertkochia solimangrovi]